MGVITHLVQEMYDHVETLNTDIDRLTELRDQMNAAILALAPNGAVPVIEPTRPGITPPAAEAVKPKQRKAPTPATTKGTATKGQPKYDYAEVARVALAAHERGKPMGAAVALGFDVSEAMGQYLIGAARKAGHAIPKRNPAARSTPAITPAEIRHEVEPIPAESRVSHDDNPVQPIVPTSSNSWGFADRPTHVEHVVETERHGWRPGMAAELLAEAAS